MVHILYTGTVYNKLIYVICMYVPMYRCIFSPIPPREPIAKYLVAHC